MNLATVMDELAAALDTLDDLRVYPYWVRRVNPPVAVVGWPDPLDYDATYGGGRDRTTMPVTVLVGRVDARSARDRLARYVDRDDPYSVKTAVDGHVTAVWDSARVQSVRFTVVTVADVDYLAGEFAVDVIGPGK